MDQHRQLHLWVTEHDYRLLCDAAAAERETLSAVIRRLIKAQLMPSVVVRYGRRRFV